MAALWNWSDLLAKINSAALQGAVQLDVLPTRHPDYRIVKSANIVVVIHGEPDGKFSWSDSDGNSNDGTAAMVSWQIVRRLASVPMAPIEIRPQKKKSRGRNCFAAAIIFLIVMFIIVVVVIVVLLK